MPFKQVAQIMSECAREIITEDYRGIPINVDIVKETQGIGSGCGIL